MSWPTSVETAVVSIPETKDGQVLALVEEPGKPSEMISVPQPEAKPRHPPPESRPPRTGGRAARMSNASLPQAEAAAAPEPAKQPGACRPAARCRPKVSVEAVEIEGRKIFVAGVADPGRKVRGYANDILLGDAQASPDGRFLIEAERDLPVGDYIIRVDALEPDGVKVVARAAVPFEREPGEAIAAIAPASRACRDQSLPPAAVAEAPAAPADGTRGTRNGARRAACGR